MNLSPTTPECFSCGWRPLVRNWLTAHRSITVGAALTAAYTILSALKDLDAATLTDLRTWVVGVAVASVREVAVYLLSKIQKAD